MEEVLLRQPQGPHCRGDQRLAWRGGQRGRHARQRAPRPQEGGAATAQKATGCVFKDDGK